MKNNNRTIIYIYISYCPPVITLLHTPRYPPSHPPLPPQRGKGDLRIMNVKPRN